MVRLVASLVLLFNISVGFSQDIIWADQVVNFSTQLDPVNNSAKQVLGAPNAGVGESVMAWQPQLDIRRENINVSYSNPIKIKQVIVVENTNPGSVYRVTLYDEAGEAHSVYSATAVPLDEPSRNLIIKLDELTTYNVASVKVSLDCRNTPGVQQIDAIGVSSTEAVLKEVKPEVADIKFYSELEKLSGNVNSEYSELGPLISPDGKTLYVCRDNHPETFGGQEIWYSRLDDNGEWLPAVRMERPLNNANANFVSSITPDGNVMLLGNQYFFKKKGDENFTQTKREVKKIRKGKMENDLFDFNDLLAHPENYEEVNSFGSGFSLSVMTEKGWSYPINSVIEAYSNQNKYVNYFLANDNKRVLMAIQNEESRGDLDLCFSTMTEDGSWSKPINMGDDLNTIAGDFAPFLASDNKTLYFSSAGHTGFGSSDIFVSRRLDDTWKSWSKPLNLGPIINSSDWDAYFTIPAKGDYAYLVREGDIYRLRLNEELKPEPVVLLFGEVLDSKTNKPVFVDIEYENLATGEGAGYASSNPETGEYKVVLPAGGRYGCRAIKDGYYAVNENIDLTKLEEYKEVKRDMFLYPLEKGEVIRLNNIFFDFGEASLQKESFAELNRIVELLKENGAIKIRINGHTDNVGDLKSNVALSQNRAQSVVDYLVSKGIEKVRLSAKGYGESAPLNSNETEEGRAYNRRVEFEVM